jgi:hypothetical protein
MKSLFETSGYEDVLSRIEQLDKNASPIWGTMSINQMLKHCQGPLEVGIGKKQLTGNIGFIKKMVFKLFKFTMYNDKPWKPNLPTVSDYVVKDELDFNSEKLALIEIINKFSKMKNNTNWPEHPYFGTFTTQQWGKLQYKHLDHHLRQFGV